MNTTRNLLTLVLAGALAVPFAASAASVFQPSDSESGYRIESSAAGGGSAGNVAIGMPKAGDVSANGSYVYKDAEKGWGTRGHAYRLVDGRLAHTSECDHIPTQASNAPLPQLPGYFQERGV